MQNLLQSQTQRSASFRHQLEGDAHYSTISSRNEVCTRIYYTVSSVMMLISSWWFDFCNKIKMSQGRIKFKYLHIVTKSPAPTGIYSSDRVPPHTTLCWAEIIFWECWLALLLNSVLCSGHSSSIAYLNKRIQNHLIKERSPLKTGNSVPRRSKDKVAVIAPVEVSCHYLMRFPWFLSLHCFEIGIPYSV